LNSDVKGSQHLFRI